MVDLRILFFSLNLYQTKQGDDMRKFILLAEGVANLIELDKLMSQDNKRR